MEILLAMQAAGMVTDWLAMRNQIQMGRLGAKMEQAGINANISMTRLEAEDSALESMKSLRMALGSQIAISAARGVKSGAGSALSISSDSISKFNADARARRMNLLAKEATLRATGVLSGLHQFASETQLGQSMTKRFTDNFPASSLAGGQGGKSSFTPA